MPSWRRRRRRKSEKFCHSRIARNRRSSLHPHFGNGWHQSSFDFRSHFRAMPWHATWLSFVATQYCHQINFNYLFEAWTVRTRERLQDEIQLYKMYFASGASRIDINWCVTRFAKRNHSINLHFSFNRIEIPYDDVRFSQRHQECNA